VTRYTRFRSGSRAAYGILEDGIIRELQGGLFDPPQENGERHAIEDVQLLAPAEPRKIACVGLNYKSHLNGRPQPAHPEIFYKPVTALQDPGGPIEIPREATDLHYEGELVVVIGKHARNLSPAEARQTIFGVTCGNDVSERNWQHGAGKDLQWWRAKGCDTFAPLGPVVVAGIEYDNLLLQTRLNGEVVQKQYTADLIFDCAAIVSRISGWVTLEPGDLIYTGTPGSTRKLSPGDVVEVEIEGIGVLQNPVIEGRH
jgi:2-keto-4-pentenoate hydratase/2-oxohepta-3-ene-1,7-dioic acid hydratase in catechol pathway